MTSDQGGVTLRNATSADWAAMADVASRGWRADGLADARTGQSLADDNPESDHFTMERDVLVAEVDGELAGYLMGFRVVRDGMLVAETRGAMAPEHRRRGIGTRLWLATRDRLAAECATDPRPGPGELRTHAMDAEAGDRALLNAMGYVPIRYGFEMCRYLTGSLPEHPVPEGLVMRPAVEPEYRAIFDADCEAFQDHWGHRENTEADFQMLFYRADVDPSRFLVAWDGDQVAGVVMNAIFDDENQTLGTCRGWLEHVSVRSAWRGRGVAKALCSASFRLLRDLGMDEAWLGVDGSNPTGALQLYEGLGFKVVHRWQAYGRPLDRPASAGWRSKDGSS